MANKKTVTQSGHFLADLKPLLGRWHPLIISHCVIYISQFIRRLRFLWLVCVYLDHFGSVAMWLINYTVEYARMLALRTQGLVTSFRHEWVVSIQLPAFLDSNTHKLMTSVHQFDQTWVRRILPSENGQNGELGEGEKFPLSVVNLYVYVIL